MSMRDLVNWGRRGNQPPSLSDDGLNPLLAFQREMNRVFDDFSRGFFGGPLTHTAGWANAEVVENDKEIRVTLEVPGVDEKDLEILLADEVLTVRGEKRSEVEDADKAYSERFYGRFERRIPLGAEIVEQEVKASFRNGVLGIVLPKRSTGESRAKRIPISK
jgi:HSP20 family protein